MTYNPDAEIRVLSFIEGLCVHWEGDFAGKPFILMPWQRDFVRRLFGELREDGLRQYRTAFLELPRKQGKTALGAAIALYMLLADGEQGAQVISAAGSKEQASLVYRSASEMVKRSPALARLCVVNESRKRITVPRTSSYYQAVPADAALEFGLSPSGVIFDELHVQPDRRLVDAFQTAMGARRQPLLVYITTAGYDRQSVCWETHEYARQIQDGMIRDDTFLPVIYAADEADDWTDPEVWRKANPSLGVTLREDDLAQECARAKHLPGEQNPFKRFHLNLWTQQSDRWIDMALWDENAGEVDEAELEGRTCYGGLDLSSVSDLTAWVLVFPHDDDPETVDILARFWCPEDKLTDERNRYQAQYQAWAREGLLLVTPGNAVDYAFVKKTILADAQRFHLVSSAMDRLFQGQQLSQELADEGVEIFPLGQGFLSMTPLTHEFERRLLSKKLHHGHNPVLDWQADSVAVVQDATGGLKVNKATSQGRVDGIISLLMALDRQMRAPKERRSVYENHGLQWA